ncbi:hypothetical protein ElyMa_005291100 [Elysia marginata]|uniref:Uncharacterized protein n=1 Tax=Elysia marginata TaxID=1093978 RepID=A0AAV4K245_9GAST|nr:hypothetical protein ElyMa_005291100 [Elysia marginata]
MARILVNKYEDDDDDDDDDDDNGDDKSLKKTEQKKGVELIHQYSTRHIIEALLFYGRSSLSARPMAYIKLELIIRLGGIRHRRVSCGVEP